MDLIARTEALKSKHAHIEHLLVEEEGRPWPNFDLVHELKSCGFRLGVLTNNVRELRQAWWPMLDFANIFDDVVDSHEVGMRKPNHAIYKLSLSRLGVEAHRTAFLDDAQSNVDAATAVGMHGIWVDIDPTDAVQRVRQLANL